MSNKEILLIDFNNMVYRVHYTHMTLTTQDGRPTGVLHGVLQSVLSLGRKYPSSTMVFCVDSRNSWRKEMCPTYKAHRKNANNSERNIASEQIPIVLNLLTLMGFPCLQFDKMEADDIIGYLANKLGQKRWKVRVLSNDKDFFQLLSLPYDIEVVRPHDSKFQVVREDDVEKEFGIEPSRWAEFRALSGDASDNIKAIPGVGPKKALKMLQAGVSPKTHIKFSTHSNKVKRAFGSIEEYWPAVRVAYQLSKLGELSVSKFKTAPKWLTDFEDGCKMFLQSPGVQKWDADETRERAEEVVSILSDYELESIIARRNEFWQIR